MRRVFTLLAALAVTGLDRITKEAAVLLLVPGKPVIVVPGIFQLTLVMNKGAAFGLLREALWPLILIALAVIVAIAFIVSKRGNLTVMVSVSLGLVLGGAVGNLIDRIRLGAVIDFLDFRVWPVFNIADSAITIGVALLAYTFVFNKRSIN